MEAFIFKKLENDHQLFFEIIPQDWQDEIVPFWDAYKYDAKIYIIENDKTLVGGGIVFYKSPPSFQYFETEAVEWFDKGFLYLGFIWIAEHHRNKNLGSFWLDQLKAQNLNQKYFLLTEDAYLQHFYEKNGFLKIKTLQNQDHLEWLYVSESDCH